MTQFTPYSAFAGGSMIGLAAVFLLMMNGRIAGISGILGGCSWSNRKDLSWRIAFLLGMILGGTLVYRAGWVVFPSQYTLGFSRLIVAGLLVGFGTQLGSGCTSGHGVCGVARLSRRSIVATLTFIAAGALTVAWFF